MTGSGTPADPYIIYDINDLQAIQSDLGAYYELAGDIDASATSGWDGGKGFAPIYGFTGSLDGKGHKVDSLFMNREHRGGMLAVAFIEQFGYGEPRVVKNLGLTNVDITAITGQVAGFIGLNAGTITNCYTTGTLLAIYGWGGGFVHQNIGTIEDCYTECTLVTIVGYAAGFVESNSKIIRRCYATGDVTAKANAGGFVRYNSFGGALIQDCYCRGNVTSSNNYPVGGFIDNNFSGAVVDNCYSTGTLTTTGTKGGFCRKNQAAIVTNCFWDIETSGQATSDGGTGKTTAQMQTKSTFKEAGWNLKTIWNMLATVNGGYPCLCNVTGNCPTAVIKGNPNIDQLIYQHVERMGR